MIDFDDELPRLSCALADEISYTLTPTTRRALVNGTLSAAEQQEFQSAVWRALEVANLVDE